MPDPLAEPGSVLEFWFGDGMRARWFRSSPALDDAIRNRFEGVWQAAASGALDDWARTAEGALALVITLDQLPLNMYRGQARAFATGAQAVRVSRGAIAQGLDRRLEAERLAFLYMPLMHSEDLADQELSVRLYEAAGLDDNARFARHHREIVRRFGRFPHRNAMLGRAGTVEEAAYLGSDKAFLG